MAFISKLTLNLIFPITFVLVKITYPPKKKQKKIGDKTMRERIHYGIFLIWLWP